MAKRGGKREGAGRPKGTPLPPRPDKDDLRALLEALNQPAGDGKDGKTHKDTYLEAQWRELTEAKDLRIRLDARKYLTDQNYGKATQPVQLEGHMDHTIVNDIPGPVRERKSK